MAFKQFIRASKKLHRPLVDSKSLTATASKSKELCCHHALLHLAADVTNLGALEYRRLCPPGLSGQAAYETPNAGQDGHQ